MEGGLRQRNFRETHETLIKCVCVLCMYVVYMVSVCIVCMRVVYVYLDCVCSESVC